MRNTKIPVTIITGFLGSGKTTLLNRLLHNPQLTDTAVIVNEFGEIGLDHLLVESAIDQMVLMDNGCLCCSVRGDLVDTLEDLLRRVAAGSVPSFRRVMIETTGLADPAPIVQTLISSDAMTDRFSFHSIVATIDAVNGAATLDEYDEARSQAAMADLIVMTKTDMDRADLAAATAAVRDLNPRVEMVSSDHGAIDPALIIGRDGDAIDAWPKATHHNRDAGANDRPAAPHQADADRHHSGNGHGHSGEHEHGRDGRIQSVSIVIDTPLPWAHLKGWLEWLTALRGPDVLRIKGLVRVEGFSGPVLIHGVQHVFHAPRVLPDWPDADHRSRIIIIARDIPQAALRASLTAYRQLQAAADTMI